MKKPLFAIFFLFTILHLTSNPSFPTKDGAVWQTVFAQEEYYICDSQTTKELETTAYFALKGDTIIDGLMYNKIYVDNGGYSFYGVYSWSDLNPYCGAIRTEGDSVWFRAKESDKECLLYDFSREIGDTIQMDGAFVEYTFIEYNSLLPSEWKAVVSNIEWDEKGNKIMYLEQPENYLYPNDIWKEGIGSLLYGPITGFFYVNYPICGSPTDFVFKLVSYKENGIIEYNTCTDKPQSLPDNEFFSNIFVMNSYLSVVLNSDCLPAIIHLFDSTGKVILSQTISEQQTSFDLSHLPKGVLMYQITPLEGKREIGKIINQ